MTSDPFGRARPGASFDFDGEYGAEYAAFAARVIPAYEATFELGFAVLDRVVPAEARVLVVGCGAGADLATLAHHAPGWKLTGVDPSPQMIRLARERLRTVGLEDRCRLFEGFVSELPARPAYDAATLYNVMHFLPDDGAKVALVTSIADRLRPGAPLVVIDLHGDPASDAFAVTRAVWRRFIELHDLPPARIDAFFEQLEAGIHWVPERRIEAVLAEAGFVGVSRFFHALLYGGWVAHRGDDGR